MATTKLTTGLTGLKVAKHPHVSLKNYYDRILLVLEKIPQEAAYRQHTAALVKNNLEIVAKVKDVEQLEKKLGGEQMEEYIMKASRELSLARKMLTWRPWESMVAEPPKNQWKWPA